MVWVIKVTLQLIGGYIHELIGGYIHELIGGTDWLWFKLEALTFQ